MSFRSTCTVYVCKISPLSNPGRWLKLSCKIWLQTSRQVKLNKIFFKMKAIICLKSSITKNHWRKVFLDIGLRSVNDEVLNWMVFKLHTYTQSIAISCQEKEEQNNIFETVTKQETKIKLFSSMQFSSRWSLKSKY